VTTADINFTHHVKQMNKTHVKQMNKTLVNGWGELVQWKLLSFDIVVTCISRNLSYRKNYDYSKFMLFKSHHSSRSTRSVRRSVWSGSEFRKIGYWSILYPHTQSYKLIETQTSKHLTRISTFNVWTLNRQANFQNLSAAIKHNIKVLSIITASA